MSRTLQLVIAVGDPPLEAALQAALEAMGHGAARCLAATDLLACLRAERPDAALVGADLYQLTPERWAELREAGVPLVLRADPADAAQYPSPVATLGTDAAAEALAAALLAAASGRAAHRRTPLPASDDPASAVAPSAATVEGGRVFAVSGPTGSGRTTFAANFALALATQAPTIAVDADTACPALAAALDGDVTRGLAALAQAAPDRPAAWERALAGAGQPLHARCPHGVLLGGLTRPEQRSIVGRAFSERLVAELRRRFAYVVLDAGGDVLGPDTGLHRAALLAADDLLVVTRADPLGVYGARMLLELWLRQLGAPEERMALVIAGHDRRRHHAPAAIAYQLRVPLAAVLPEDRAALHRAQLACEPALFGRGRYAAAVLAFADRACGGPVRLPEEVQRARRRRWPFHPPRRRASAAQEGGIHGGDAVPAS